MVRFLCHHNHEGVLCCFVCRIATAVSIWRLVSWRMIIWWWRMCYSHGTIVRNLLAGNDLLFQVRWIWISFSTSQMVCAHCLFFCLAKTVFLYALQRTRVAKSESKLTKYIHLLKFQCILQVHPKIFDVSIINIWKIDVAVVWSVGKIRKAIKTNDPASWKSPSAQYLSLVVHGRYHIIVSFFLLRPGRGLYLPMLLSPSCSFCESTRRNANQQKVTAFRTCELSFTMSNRGQGALRAVIELTNLVVFVWTFLVIVSKVLHSL